MENRDYERAIQPFREVQIPAPFSTNPELETMSLVNKKPYGISSFRC